jgi:hypothetical protein
MRSFTNAPGFLGVSEELAEETGSVVPQDLEDVGLLDPGSGLADHDFYGVIVRRVRDLMGERRSGSVLGLRSEKEGSCDRLRTRGL